MYHPVHTLLVHPAEHLLSALTSADRAQPNYNQATHRIFFIATLPLKCFSHFLSLFVTAMAVEAFFPGPPISFTLNSLLILLFEQEGYWFAVLLAPRKGLSSLLVFLPFSFSQIPADFPPYQIQELNRDCTGSQPAHQCRHNQGSSHCLSSLFPSTAIGGRTSCSYTPTLSH